MNVYSHITHLELSLDFVSIMFKGCCSLKSLVLSIQRHVPLKPQFIACLLQSLQVT